MYECDEDSDCETADTDEKEEDYANYSAEEEEDSKIQTKKSPNSAQSKWNSIHTRRIDRFSPWSLYQWFTSCIFFFFLHFTQQGNHCTGIRWSFILFNFRRKYHGQKRSTN
eukprot:5667673-Ditylum_brightwellii.AAC.2